MLNFNIPGIDKIIHNIHVATGFKCVIYDSKFNIILAHPDTMCNFCKLVRKNPKYAQKCKNCDAMGLGASLKSLKTEVYKCHMGLTEAISPIVYGNTVIGFIMIGQLLTDESKKEVEKSIASYPDKELIPQMKSEYQKLSATKHESIYAAVSIIEMCASYIWLKQLVKFNFNNLAYSIHDYICEHISDDLSLPVLCSVFSISKSSLYALSLKEFGKGISEYIRDLRLEKAEQLLLGTDLAVSMIAEQTGFADTNYFIKVFKKHHGTSPLKWKKQWL